MPTIGPDNAEEQSENPFVDQLQNAAQSNQEPVVVTGVNRKINIGGFENIDIYIGFTVPISHIDNEDSIEKMKKGVKYFMGLASQETYERYVLVKEGLNDPGSS